MCIDFAVYSLTLKDSNCLAPASRSTSRHQQHHVLSIMCWCFNSEHWLKKSLMVFTHHLPTGQMSGSSLSAPNNHTHLYEALKLCVPLLFRAELRKRKTMLKKKWKIMCEKTCWELHPHQFQRPLDIVAFGKAKIMFF